MLHVFLGSGQTTAEEPRDGPCRTVQAPTFLHEFGTPGHLRTDDGPTNLVQILENLIVE